MMSTNIILHNIQFKVKSPVALFQKSNMISCGIYFPDVRNSICYQFSFSGRAVSNVRDFLFLHLPSCKVTLSKGL